jgi:hypothetical protein
MSTIIAGRFEQQAAADAAMSSLQAAGFSTDRMSKFFVTPPGMHDLHGTTNDPDASAGAHQAHTGAIAGATAGGGVGVLAGIATAPLLGPGAALAGAALGAYVGSLAGALDQTKDPQQTPSSPGASAEEAPPRKSGVLVAVEAPTEDQQANAIALLRQHGAHDVERAEGVISGGDWTDFDPLQPVVPVERSVQRRL